MSGGSHNYAYEKIILIAEGFGDLPDAYHEQADDEYEQEKLDLLQHPLRKALARFLVDEVAPVLKAIEWSDSADTAADAWIAPTRALLDRRTTPDG